MNRRAFLAAGGAVGLAGVAGCLNAEPDTRSLYLRVNNDSEEFVFGVGRLLVDGEVIGLLEFQLRPGPTDSSTTTQFTAQISAGTEVNGEITVNGEREQEVTMTADCDHETGAGDGIIFRVQRTHIGYQHGCAGPYDEFPINQHGL